MAHSTTPASHQPQASAISAPILNETTTVCDIESEPSTTPQVSGQAALTSYSVGNAPPRQQSASQRPSKVQANRKSWATVASTDSAAPTSAPSPTGHSINVTSSAMQTSGRHRSPSRPQSTNENEPQQRTPVGEENGTILPHAGRKFEQKTVVDEKNSVYVKNVIQAVTRDIVRDAFSKFGVIRHIDVVPTKGIAFVEFTTSEPVNKAVAQNNLVVTLPDGTRHTLLTDRRKIFSAQGRNSGPRYANQEDHRRPAGQQQQRGGGFQNHSNGFNKQQETRGAPKSHPKGTKE
jgi:hypothetical protein